ncbi:hypothetical protein [Mesorhizobium sp. CN2-181]|uniref:hypothetical protein n=1 Tax=Mesorhizobium yinganensis TaxID=3157707 RepID=UPI0032B821C0
MAAADDDEALAERTQSLVRVAENIAISRGLHEAANHFAARDDTDNLRFLRDPADLFAHYVIIDIAAAARVTARVQDSTDGKLLARLTEACIDGGCAVGAVH